MVEVFRLNWIKAFLANPDALWFHISKNIFDKIGGLEFLLKCDFEVSKLPVRLSEYHKQVLSYWKMVFTHNFTPHGSTLWNNRVITVNRKMLFIHSWYKKGVIFVTDLLDDQGNFLTFMDFKIKYNIQGSLREFNKVCKAIPVALLNMIKSHLQNYQRQTRLPKLQLNQININNKKCNNNIINKILKGKIFHDFEQKIKM